MFDEVVINDLIQRFLEKKNQLSNYNYIQDNSKGLYLTTEDKPILYT